MDGSILADSQAKSDGLVDSYLAFSVHSSNEQGEYSQLARHDDSTTNIVIGIIRPHCNTT